MSDKTPGLEAREFAKQLVESYHLPIEWGDLWSFENDIVAFATVVVEEREAEHSREVMGAIHRYIPAGSPPPGDWRAMLSWTLNEQRSRAEQAAARCRVLEGALAELIKRTEDAIDQAREAAAALCKVEE